MEKQGYKTLALVFILLFILENILFIVAYLQVVDEEDKTMICYHEICQDYYDAEYDPTNEVCYCYTTDVLGYLVVNKTRYMG